MKALLVYSLRGAVSARHPVVSMEFIHIGLSYVASSLQARGHETRLVVLSSDSPKASLAILEREIDEFNPRLVGFTAVSTQFPFICSAADLVKKRRGDLFLVIGGVHASLRPSEAIQGPLDAVCVGEGELAMADLADRLAAHNSLRGIPGLWLKTAAGQIERTAPREFIRDLDSLPVPDRRMWEPWVAGSRFPHQVILPSRGCPFNCSYCCNHALRKVSTGKYVRLRSPAGILQELQQIKGTYSETSHVYLQSETIAIDVEWLEDLASNLASFNEANEPRVSFTCNFRVARRFLDPRVFSALARANVRTVEIGLESGSERLRREVLRRNYSNEEFYRAVELARAEGMAVNVYNMIGLPGETLEDHEQTIEVNRRVCPSRSLTVIFYPYPGTDLEEACRAQGLLGDRPPVTAERFRATMDLPGFSRRQIQRAYRLFEYRVYKGHWPWRRRVRQLLRNGIYGSQIANRLFMRLVPIWHALNRNAKG